MNAERLQNHYSVRKWFSTIFIVLSLLFCLALVPLVFYLQNTFYNLQHEKNLQSLNMGTKELDTIVTGITNVSRTLADDSTFRRLRYVEPDYDSVPFSVQKRLRYIFSNMLLPYNIISDAALQMAPNVVICTDNIFFESHTMYYPDLFCVNNLFYDEWLSLLSEYSSTFLPVCHVKSFSQEYDALIYSVKWSRSSYIYACLNISDVKNLFFPKADQNGCYFSIKNAHGDILYRDLPDSVQKYQTLTSKTSTSSLEICIYIENSCFFRALRPMYIFLAVYIFVYFILLIVSILLGTNISTAPVFKILQTLELSQNTVLVHQKVLQTRFFEKAIFGQFAGSHEIEQFHCYFPAFPKQYCLVLIRLLPDLENTTALYTEPLLLIQSFLQGELPGAYLQQLSDTELLLLIAAEDFQSSREVLDFVVSNINEEEPAYTIRCASSRVYQNIESLPAAYRQIRVMEGLSAFQNNICTPEDCLEATNTKINVAMTELLTLYTAISHGNKDMALKLLGTCSAEIRFEQNATFHKTAYDMIYSILTCVKLEHPKQLIDEHIPPYKEGRSLYVILHESVSSFCSNINDNDSTEITPLAKALLQYVDEHYYDYDLCLTTLETHFKCSPSTISKIFKQATNMTMSKYIEQKRMNRANELLAQGQKTVTEIAAECGFGNPNSFYKAYKRFYGYAPTLQHTETDQ